MKLVTELRGSVFRVPNMDEHRVSGSARDIPKTKRDSRSLKRDDPQDPEHSDGEGEIIKTVPFLKLFCFADPKDKVLIAVGTIAACANGATLSLMTVLLGDMIDSFGKNQGTNEVVK